MALICLVRHAEAGDPDPSQWPDDGDRPITDKGRRRFTKAAKGLGTLFRPEKVIASPNTRTVQTAEILQNEANWPKADTTTILDDGAEPQDVLDLIEEMKLNNAFVGIVGHGSNMTELISYILSGDESAITMDFKKGSSVLVNMPPSMKPGTGELVWFMDQTAMKGI